MKRGKFLVLEGIDGAGTTTQAGLLKAWLTEQGISPVVTREPSDGPIGLVIRNALGGRIRLSEPAGGGTLTHETIALLFAADRVDHLRNEVAPALEQGKWVLSDRYVHSSIAYQGTMLDAGWVAAINRYAVEPDLTLFVEVEVERALQRIAATRTHKDLFETRELLTRIAEGYRRLYAGGLDRVVVVDGNLPVEAVRMAIIEAVKKAFPADLS